MSHSLIARDPSLLQLLNEGYELEVRQMHLLVHSVPYVKASGEVQEDGVLVMKLAGEASTVPPDHTAYFIGGHPCTKDGAALTQIVNSSGTRTLATGLVADHYLSAKPRAGRYENFHEKVTLYVEMISGPARAVRPDVSVRTYKPVASPEEDSVFLYLDTASSRAGLLVATQRFHGLKIAIVGLGGTGAYVLDQVAKTPVAEIHLFDSDVLQQHNAFRTPGALSLAELEEAPGKVEYLQSVYSKMRRGVVPHTEMITPENVEQLRAFDHVFLCVDKGSVRRWVVDTLRGSSTCLFDVGMGVELDEETQTVSGICRVTALAGSAYALAERCIPMADMKDHGIYTNNVQIADLNALNASLAVIRWKKACGFYANLENSHQTAYTIFTNLITNDESQA